MQVNLVHYSKEPLPEVLRSTAQEHDDDVMWKPKGLWVSCEKPDEDPAQGDGWIGWCQGEQWGMERLAHRAVITLKPDANVLTLNSADAILEFSQIYGSATRHRIERIEPRFDVIDWPGVAEHYNGILIYPYQWSLRLDMRVFWYYTWDCASGCIWDTSIIDTIERGAGYTKAALTRKSENAA